MEDRRKFPTCEVPCKPIADKLDKTVSQRLFMWLIGPLAGFVIIVQGSFLWTIKENVTEIKIEQIKINMKLDIVEKRLKATEEYFNKIEKFSWNYRGE